jgi:hypothetical protein
VAWLGPRAVGIVRAVLLIFAIGIAEMVREDSVNNVTRADVIGNKTLGVLLVSSSRLRCSIWCGSRGRRAVVRWS